MVPLIIPSVSMLLSNSTSCLTAVVLLVEHVGAVELLSDTVLLSSTVYEY